MKNQADHLDATEPSRVAWLYLLENNEPEGGKYAARVLAPGHAHFIPQ